MFKSKQDLINAVLGRDKAHTAARERLTKNIQKLYKDYVLRIKALVYSPAGLSNVEIMNIVSAQRVVEQLTPLLIDAGLENTIAVYLEQFPTLTKASLEYFKRYERTVSLSGVDRGALEGFIKYSEVTLRDNVDRKFVAPLSDAIFQTAFGKSDQQGAIDRILSLTDSLRVDQVETLVSDSYQQFLRTVSSEKAAALDLDIFVYVGPDDDKTSEQCGDILSGSPHGIDGLYTRDEISSDMVDGLNGDPMIAGGHPNCRHEFVPISREEAIERGATGL